MREGASECACMGRETGPRAIDGKMHGVGVHSLFIIICSHVIARLKTELVA